MTEYTLEQSWAASPQLRDASAINPNVLLGGAARLVVVSPHPDDEMLAAAGLIAEALEQGATLLVVSVTDGEASHAGSAWWTKDRLRSARSAELDVALAALGGRSDAITRLHLADGAVGSSSEALLDHLVGLLRSDDLVVCPWRSDGHPDHEAVAQAVLSARRELGFRLLEAPIWMWHWQAPDATGIPWPALRRIPLSRRAISGKARALAAFKSQVTIDPSLADSPVVTEAMLAHFQRPFEAFFADVA